MRWARWSDLLGTSKIAAFLIFAAVAASLCAVQPSGAQTARSTAKSIIASSGNPQNGKDVYTSQGCDRCHGSQGEGLSATGTNGGVPPLASTTLSLPSFIQLVRKPIGQMPAYGSKQVSDQELGDVYAFLRAAKAPVEQAVSVPANGKDGERLYKKDGCYECHLSHGQGARATGARIGPPQLPLSAFVSYVRHPTGEMPPYTQKVVSDEELAEMYAFLQSAPQAPSWKATPLLNQ